MGHFSTQALHSLCKTIQRALLSSTVTGNIWDDGYSGSLGPWVIRVSWFPSQPKMDTHSGWNVITCWIGITKPFQLIKACETLKNTAMKTLEILHSMTRLHRFSIVLSNSEQKSSSQLLPQVVLHLVPLGPLGFCCIFSIRLDAKLRSLCSVYCRFLNRRGVACHRLYFKGFQLGEVCWVKHWRQKLTILQILNGSLFPSRWYEGLGRIWGKAAWHRNYWGFSFLGVPRSPPHSEKQRGLDLASQE